MIENKITYNQWFEGVFPELFNESMVYFSACDKTRRLTLENLLRLASDIAVEDCRARDMSSVQLLEHGFAILVSRLSLRIHKMPQENQKITMHTIEEKPQPLQFVRTYEITDTITKQSLVSGTSTWLLVDMNTRRLLPLKKFTLRTPPQENFPHDCLPADKLNITGDLVLLDTHKVKNSDIDANGHVNNAKYAGFITDALGDFYTDHVLKDFRINYNKEAMLGENVDIYQAKTQDKNQVLIVGKVGESICFHAELIF